MRKNRWKQILLILAFLTGLSLLLYPTFSNYWNSTHQSRMISAYMDDLASIDTEEIEALRQEAVDFNTALKKRTNVYTLPDELRLKYNNVLDTSGTGIMGYIDIPAMKETLPIYHGTSEGVLQNAIGHLEWSSLPVGGEGTHCVLSGHRGLPSTKLFSDLDQLIVGDVFMLQVLDETLTYEVDQILIVEPEDVTALVAAPGQDYCTLVTCTPYGMNTHRMLVRGHRIENMEQAKTVRIISEAVQIEPLIVAPVLAVPLLMLLFVIMIASKNDHGNPKRNMIFDEEELL